MIHSTLTHAAAYRHLGARIAQGLDWLASVSPDLPDGRYDLAGDELYALVQSYNTCPPSEKRFESHKRYIDIQFVAAGTETIHHAPVDELTPATAYDSKDDFLLYADPKKSTPLHMSPGTFAIFFPDDGHKPSCDDGAPQHVKKVVLKLRV